MKASKDDKDDKKKDSKKKETSLENRKELLPGEVRKVFKPLAESLAAPGSKKNVSTSEQSLSEFEKMVKQWLAHEIDRYHEDYQEELRELAGKLECGGSYYLGEHVYIIDGIKAVPHPYHKARKIPGLKEYYLLVREWKRETQTWGPMKGYRKGYEFMYKLEEFVKSYQPQKLSKTPDKLWEEAEQALLSGDIAKYAMDAAHDQGQEHGPDTQLLHVGSKESLAAVQKDLEGKRNHALTIQNTMEMIIAEKMRSLEAIKDKMNSMLVVFERQIKKIMRVITTIELYLGISEDIVQIQEGATANENDPICIRQGILYMDEEIGDPSDDGQGLEWDKKGIAAFDDWLCRAGNYKKVAPETKGIIAFQARRDHKQRASRGNPFANLAKMENDMQTFLLIRNGDNLYRLITDKIVFRPRLFPRRNELQKLFEYWKVADAIERKEQDPEAWMSLDGLSEKDQEHFKFRSRDHRTVNDAKNYAEDSVFFYKMRLTLFQGLIDRTPILFPLQQEKEYKLFSAKAQEDGLVRLIYDDELTLPSGRKPFWEWLEEINSGISFGSRIVLSHNWGFLTTVGKHKEMEEYDYRDSNTIHTERLDERFGSKRSGKFTSLPPRPAEGLYYIKKGERFQTEPVWIDNPYFDPNLIETPEEAKYSPELNRKYWPKDPKTVDKDAYRGKESSYHFEVNPRVQMTYAEQKAYFGKVVEKGIGPEAKTEHHYIHGILKNPRRIHKYTLVNKNETSFEDDDGLTSKNVKVPNWEYQEVKHEFLCIRYNPKDTIGENNYMFRKWDEELTERKVNISWKIFPTDAFIINYDALTLEDIDFYLNSRVDRRHYIFMMPLLMQVRQTLAEERKSEVDFKTLVQGSVLNQTGILPDDELIDAAVEEWKTNLKWKRAIAHDDSKALRMIVKAIIRKIN